MPTEDRPSTATIESARSGASEGIDSAAEDLDKSDWHPEIRETLYRAAFVDRTAPSAFESLVAALERDHGDVVYSNALHLLSHLRFDAAEAKQCWGEIAQHRCSMSERLGREVDLRLALLDYFLQINRKLDSPKIIEMRLFEQTRASAYRDDLTGLHNYRFFSEAVEQELRRGQRYGEPVSLLMFDVDDFKQLNDSHGHCAGNSVLVSIACLISTGLRKLDLAARYGGEEFTLILPSTPKVGAQLVAERLRSRIESHEFALPDSTTVRVTMSIGVATFPADAAIAAELVRHADRAMYVAKSNGKNQVQLYGHSCRSYRRVPAALTGFWRTVSGTPETLTTIDISEGGILFQSRRPLAPGALVEIELELPDSQRHLQVVGRVVKVEEPVVGLGEWEVAVGLINQSTRDQSLLLNYVRDISPRSDADDPGALA